MVIAKIDLLFESALILASVCFSLCVYVLSRGVSNKLNLAYSALTLALSIWSLAFFIANVLHWRFFESIHILSTLVLAPLALLFIHVLLRPEGAIYRWLLRLSIAWPVVLFTPVLFGLDRYIWIRDLSYYSPTLIMIACLYLLLSEAFGAEKPRGSRTEFSLLMSAEMFQALRRRNFWVYLGGVSTTFFCVMDRVPWLGRTIPAIGNFLLILYFYFLKDIVLHRSLVNPRKTIGRVLTNVVGAFVVSLIFFLITRWVQVSHFLYGINVLLASYVSVVSLDPVRSIAHYFFQRFFFTEASRIELLTKEASKEISGAFHGSAIAGATGKFLEKVLQTPMRSFYAIDADGKRFRKLFDGTEEQNLPEILPPSFPLLQLWEGARDWRPLLDQELETESGNSTFASKAGALQISLDSLRSLQSTVALPLTHNKLVLGFATLSATEPPELWEDSWGVLSLLAPYFEKAGEALHELDIYARLRDRDRLATIGEMAAGLAHEIRNPLGAIKGAAQVMELKAGDPNEAFLKIIVQEVNRLNGVVSQFLSYAKPFQSEHYYADLKQVVEQGVERFRRQKEGGMAFELRLWPSEPLPELLCQPELLAQVLTNLLENAYNALVKSEAKSPKKNPTISVRLAHAQQEGKVDLSLSVEDNGLGMSAETLDKIFIPFFTSSPQGTGLGLSICQKIAEAHGGHIEASSVFGEGTVMTLRFSAKQKE